MTGLGVVLLVAWPVGEADLAIANLFVSSMLGRDLYQGYSTLYDSEEVKFLIRTEPPLPRWQSLWLPFNRDTWLAMLLGLLILAPVTYIIVRAVNDGQTLVKNIGEASPGVKKGLGVFITNIGNMNFFFNTIVAPSSSGGYGARMMKESLVSYSLAMGTPSQSPLKDHLDQAISKVYKAGLSKYWKQRSYVLYRKNKRELGVGDDAALVDALIGDATAFTQLAVLSLDHLQSAFYILGCFYLFAALVCATEVVLHRCGFLHG
ncbi:hypothetical protein Pcinc_040637 [Petrolisthes cinctipes]|uniref:Uncharacterized protein n=1 Tax=Petrolisthes cinctipes TaxID=88211 RepID=A0AAE1BL34_PETCI|nr:hypothetical protein Pcinc_040637 [Petrolisthes cinctipes]